MIRALATVVIASQVVGFLPALALTRGLVGAVATAPLLAALTATAAGVTAVVSSTGPLLWFAGYAAVAAVAGVISLVRQVRAGLGPALPRGPLGGRVLIAGLLALPFVMVVRPPVDWDAQSIWIHHARWFTTGGEEVREAVGLDDFSHPEYPPLLPATGGVLSALGEPETDGRVVQAAGALLGYCATVWLAWSIADLGRRPADPLWSLIGLLVALASCAEGGIGIANAEADYLWGAAGVAAAVQLLPIGRPLGTIGAPMALAAVAALTKAEGTVLMLALLALFALRSRDRLPKLAIAATTLGPFAWVAIVRSFGATPYLTAEGNLDRIFGLEVAFVDRGSAASRAIVAEVWPLALVAIVAMGAVMLQASPTQRWAFLHRVIPLWALVVVSLGATWVVYVVSPFDIAWFIGSSVARVTLGALILLTTVVGVAAAEGLEHAFRRETAQTSAAANATKVEIWLPSPALTESQPMRLPL